MIETLIRRIRNLFIDFYIHRRSLRGSLGAENRLLGVKEVTNSSYSVIKEVIELLDLKEHDVIVDVGCGKGRVFNWLLFKGFKQRMIGCEYVINFAEEKKTAQ